MENNQDFFFDKLIKEGSLVDGRKIQMGTLQYYDLLQYVAQYNTKNHQFKWMNIKQQTSWDWQKYT